MTPSNPVERQLPEGRLTLSQAFLKPSPFAKYDDSAFRTLMNCFAYVDPSEREAFRADAEKLSDAEFFETLYWRILSSLAFHRARGCRLCLCDTAFTVRPSDAAIRGAEWANPEVLEVLCELCLHEREGTATDEQRKAIEHRRKQAWMKRNTLARRENDQESGFTRAFPGEL